MGGKLAIFRKVYEKMFTCSMVSVPLVPPLSQHVVRCSKEYTYVNLINHPLRGI